MEGIGQIKKNSDRSSTPFGVDVYIRTLSTGYTCGYYCFTASQ